MLPALAYPGGKESANSGGRAVLSTASTRTSLPLPCIPEGGNKGARAMGLPQAPNSQRQSVDSILGLIDNASRETTSGKFFNVIDGTEIPW
ncbi:Short-chain dehydrogenase/reductase SDR [Penicillium chrysogenum]|uniref:Short-chain dehydrogenase/reductase SDR n=1 Tax=Penicillium chrysogenum TaxID=5076 RepID=A0ABQ8WUC2_PENCH|nr:Short-chain dehydrogenase/reductase SDR [Penicillium chrysogenum]XP_061070027.1 Short-chain dehydrogenase/reductase SDR [Penicillium rubens]KAJ5229488.1 Short-chain dehydrogenase/reductase SDR [Penicillium chrysogenum]KAJ5258892.1 Short-chain dehydrogenase/reductase SDR [Penicillium chrysogenum]KAJ5282628.1 Short-chain dehydrogenase/reductase SDR [Penicillium chrysogenum]KAJ5839214.1 Short-chain dehydrogenase/reductase SDR [Penicillium rubens]KAJ5867267.1 Short-chain dehydrogenase/reductas